MKNNYFTQFCLAAKENLGYLLAFCTIVLGIVVSACAVPFNIDSIYDEGTHYYSMVRALDGVVSGGTQWANLLAAIFPAAICSSVLYMRIVGLCLSILTALIFYLMTQKVATSIKEKIAYFVVVFLLILPSVGGMMICYNEITQFFVIIACATLYRLCFDSSMYQKSVWALLTGFLLTLSFFSILPSAVILGGCTLVLVIVRYWKQSKELWSYLGCGLLGIGLALLIVHLFVANIAGIYSAMQETAKTVTTVNRGYDPFSFVVKICLFLRDFAFSSFIIIGVYTVAKIISNWSKIAACLVYICSILLYNHYQIKPNVTTSMIMALLWLIPLIDLQNEDSNRDKNIISFNTLFVLFLICFPLLASIGTNTYIGGKMTYFLVPWALLLWQLDYAKREPVYRNSGLIAISIILMLSIYSTYNTIDYSKNRVPSGGFKGMYMTKAQEEHFTKVDSIVSLYDFKRNESIVFTTQLSTVTMAYIEAVPCGNFFQPMDFVARSQDSLPIPDFLFLCKYDEDVAGETLKNMNWGWPQEFDKFEIGTPETVDVGYSTERWLYCRSKLLKR